MSQTPPRKLTISNLRVQNWADAGWSGFNYTLEGGTTPIKGTNSFVFKKNANDWQLVARLAVEVDLVVVGDETAGNSERSEGAPVEEEIQVRELRDVSHFCFSELQIRLSPTESV